MTNLEKWIVDLKEAGDPVWWHCYQCPAEKFCMHNRTNKPIENCAEVFEKWANEEVE